MTKTMNTEPIIREATYVLDPSSPFALDLAAGPQGGASLTASRPFSIGQSLFCADYTHRLEAPRRGSRMAVVQCLGSQVGTVKVRWQ